MRLYTHTHTHTHTHTDNFREKGITLVALAVTIVVLLILAGVSISAIVGDNGIIKKAQQSANLSNEAETKEIINRAVLEFHLSKGYETLKDFLETKVTAGTIDSVKENSDGTLTISKNGYTMTVENKTKTSSKDDNTGGSTGGNTGGETQTPTITVTGTKVVASSDGTGSALGEASTYLGNTLYINFEASITGGTTTVSPSIPYAVTENGTYNFTVTGTVNGKTYTKEVAVTVNQFKDVYEYMQANTKVSYSDGDVWVPEGFKISDDSASTVKGGIVIEDKDQNQFVWIPVASISDYKRTWFTGDGSFSSYSETLPSDEQTSVSTYKGYYIGRYEAGDKESTEAKTLRSSNDVSKTVTIKANQAPYNYVTRTQAKSLAENFGTQQNYNTSIKTKLVSSYAWDTAIAFIQKSVSDYGSSSPQGNYSNTTFTYTDIKGKSQTKSSSDLIPTGQTTPVCNIYDMGGNVWEWTTESCSNTSYPYTERGGVYTNGYAEYPAGNRFIYSDGAFINLGFRLTLFM